MIPIILDPTETRLALVGKGEPAARRLAWLQEGGTRHLTVFSTKPAPCLARAAGERLILRLPEPEELQLFTAAWIVDYDRATAGMLARAARSAGTLVNVEDVPELCDFHSPSVVRRGELLLTVSTGGRSPGLAARIRRHLESAFGAEWSSHLDRLGAERDGWRAEGRPMPEVAGLTDALIEREGWLP